VSDYTQITDFSAKDALASGDANKKILGSDVDAELAAISTAIATKGDDSGLVHTTGTETVAGNKTLSGNTTLSGTTTQSGALNVSGITTHTNKVVMTSKPVWLAEGASVASANDCDIWSAGDGNTVHVTGTTEIQDWGTAPQAGAGMWVIFDGALQLTYDGTTNKLNSGGANYTTAAGDRAFVYAASTSSYIVTVFPLSGKPFADYETGGTVLLTSGSKSAAAAQTFDLTSYTAYRNKIVKLTRIIPNTDDVDYTLKVSTNGGSSYDGAAGNYDWIGNGAYFSGGTPTAITDGNASDTAIQLVGTTVNVGNSAYMEAELRFFDMDQAQYPRIAWDVDFLEAASNGSAHLRGNARRLNAQDTDAIEVAVSSGTFTCEYAIYGWN